MGCFGRLVGPFVVFGAPCGRALRCRCDARTMGVFGESWAHCGVGHGRMEHGSFTGASGLVSMVACRPSVSAELWQAMPETVSRAVVLIQRAIGQHMTPHSGTVLSTSAALTVLAFADPLAAVRFCVQLQLALVEIQWPQELVQHPHGQPKYDGHSGAVVFRGLAASLAVHCGQLEMIHNPLTGQTEPVGPGLHAIEKLSAMGQGGQILATHALWDALEPTGQAALEAKVTTTDPVLLPGQSAPHPLHHILPEPWAAQPHNPLRRTDTVPQDTNLSAPRDSFVGRQALLERLLKTLQRPGLITLLGPGGIGKTRLALQAGRAAPRHLGARIQVWFCDLSAALDAESMLIAVAEVLGLSMARLDGVAPMQKRLADALAGRPATLLILDNFEQLPLETAALLEPCLNAAPSLRIIITSRRPLKTNAPQHHLTVTPMTQPEGAKLFTDRAATIRVQYTAADQTALERLSATVEGSPLAIELAAARAALMPLETLVERLQHSLDDLEAPQDQRRHRPDRHHTLQATIEWSWALLSDDEQHTLVQCAIFAAPWTLQDAQAIVEPGPTANTTSIIAALRDWSLIQPLEDHRMRLPISVRAFAKQHITDSQRWHRVGQRHATHYLALGQPLVKRLQGPDSAQALEALLPLQDNLLEALRFAQHHDHEMAARLTLVLDAIMSTRGPFELHRTLLGQAIQNLGNHHDTLRARLMLARGSRFWADPHGDGKQKDLLKAQALAIDTGDDALLAMVELKLASFCYHQGQTHQGLQHSQRAIEAAKRTHQPLLRAMTLAQLGVGELKASMPQKARLHLENALAIGRNHGGPRFEGTILSNLAVIAMLQGDISRARVFYNTCLSCAQQLRDRRLQALMHVNLGSAHMNHGDLPAAHTHLERGLALAREVGDRRVEALTQGNLGLLHMDQRQWDDALLHFYGAIDFFEAVQDQRCTINFGLYLTAVRASRDEDVKTEFEQLHQDAIALGDSEVIGLTGPLGGFIELATARRAQTPAEQRQALGAATACAHTDARNTGTIAHARRMLEAHIAHTAKTLGLDDFSPTNAPPLRVQLDGAWFEAPGAERTSLGRRRTLRRLLATMAHERLHRPGTTMTVDALVEAGWPGQKILPRAAANRVYVAIATLRRMGLANTLITDGQGYMLDPSIPIEII